MRKCCRGVLREGCERPPDAWCARHPRQVEFWVDGVAHTATLAHRVPGPQAGAQSRPSSGWPSGSRGALLGLPVGLLTRAVEELPGRLLDLGHCAPAALSGGAGSESADVDPAIDGRGAASTAAFTTGAAPAGRQGRARGGPGRGHRSHPLSSVIFAPRTYQNPHRSDEALKPLPLVSADGMIPVVVIGVRSGRWGGSMLRSVGPALGRCGELARGQGRRLDCRGQHGDRLRVAERVRDSGAGITRCLRMAPWVSASTADGGGPGARLGSCPLCSIIFARREAATPPRARRAERMRLPSVATAAGHATVGASGCAPGPFWFAQSTQPVPSQSLSLPAPPPSHRG